jgi:hypothetical protein
MSPVIRRARGAILRLVRRRAFALSLGLVLLVPSAWVQLGGAGRWWAEGLSLVLGATGVALIWAGLVGARPDWVE